MNKDEKKLIEEYLNDKPKIQKKGGFWNKAFSLLVIMAKAYLRYEAMKYKNG